MPRTKKFHLIKDLTDDLDHLQAFCGQKLPRSVGVYSNCSWTLPVGSSLARACKTCMRLGESHMEARASRKASNATF